MATERSVSEIVKTALRRTRFLNQEQSAPTHADQNALDVLQDLLADWSAEGLMIPYVKTESFSLVSGTSSYTIGENGSPTLNTPRPEHIIRAWVRDSSNYDHPVLIVGPRAWARITSKAGSSGRPDRMYVEYSAPNLTVYLDPNPDNSNDDLYFQHRAVLTEPTDFDDIPLTGLYIPRNYHNAIAWNLALEMVEELGGTPTQLLVKRANETKRKVMGLNIARTVEPARLDIALGGQYDYSILED